MWESTRLETGSYLEKTLKNSPAEKLANSLQSIIPLTYVTGFGKSPIWAQMAVNI